ERSAVDELVAALIHTVEYVGLDILQPVIGWSWFDALNKYAPGAAWEMASRKTGDDESESNLVEHARHELELIEEDPKVIQTDMSVVKAFSNMSHSAVSASIAISIIMVLLSCNNMPTLTDDPMVRMRLTTIFKDVQS